MLSSLTVIYLVFLWLFLSCWYFLGFHECVTCHLSSVLENSWSASPQTLLLSPFFFSYPLYLWLHTHDTFLSRLCGSHGVCCSDHPSNKDLPSSQVSIFGWQLLTQGVQGPLKILVHHHALSWKSADDWPFLPHAGSLMGHHWSGTPCWVHQNLVRSKAPQSCYFHCPPIPAHGFYSILSGGSLTAVVTPQLEWKSLPRNAFELPIHIWLAALRMS